MQSIQEVRKACEESILPVRVAYCPPHTNGNIDHVDTEFGYISDTSTSIVWVKFDKQLAKLGWVGTTSQGLTPQQLRLVPKGS